MIDKNMVMVCVMAQLQAKGKTLQDASQEEISKLIAEAIADLRFADRVVSGTR